MPNKTWAGFMWSDEFTAFSSTYSFKSKEMKEKKLIASRSQQVLNGLQKLGAVPEWIKSSWSELSLLDLSSFHSSLRARLCLVIFLSPGIQFLKSLPFLCAPKLLRCLCWTKLYSAFRAVKRTKGFQLQGC